MGRIVSNFFMSLDGVVEAPDQWHMPYFNDEMGDAIGKGMATNKAFLMGRVLYDEWAGFWPNSDDDFATFFNDHPKYVVSNSLERADWNNTTIISGDPVAAVQELKKQGDRHLVIYGYGQLAQTLLEHGLVDKLNFVVNPVMAGSGTTLFRPGKRTNLRLVSATERRNGVVTLSYAKA